MKRYLTLFFLLTASLALCAYPEGAINNIDGSVLGWDDTNQVWRPLAVNSSGKLETTGSGGGGGGSCEWTEEDIADVKTAVEDIQSSLKMDIGTVGSSDIKSVAQLFKPVYDAYVDGVSGGVLYFLHDISQGVASINTSVGNSLGSDLGAVKTSVGNSLGSDLGTIKTDIGTVKTDMGSVKTDMGSVKTDMGSVKTEVASISSHIAEIIAANSGGGSGSGCAWTAQDITDVKTGIGSLSSNLGNSINESVNNSSLNANVAAARSDIASISSNVVNGVVAPLKSNTDTIKSDTSSLLTNSNNIKTEVASISSNIGNLIAGISGGGSSCVWTAQDVQDLLDCLINIPDNSGGTTTIGNLLNNINYNVIQSNQNPSLFRTQRIGSVSASTATKIDYIADSSLPSGTTTTYEQRKFVELRAIDPTAEFYIGFDNTVTDSTGRPVIGRILLNMDTTTDLYIYHVNSSAIAIQQTEGWVMNQ